MKRNHSFYPIQVIRRTRSKPQKRKKIKITPFNALGCEPKDVEHEGTQRNPQSSTIPKHCSVQKLTQKPFIYTTKVAFEGKEVLVSHGNNPATYTFSIFPRKDAKPRRKEGRWGKEGTEPRTE
jgi:hypothetical protein